MGLLMNLLFKREQTEGRIGKVWFKLWAKTELDEDEQRIVKRYDFSKAVLINVLQPDLMRNAILIGLGVTAVAWLLLSILPLPSAIETLLTPGAGIAAGYFFYDRQRESISRT